MSARVCGGADHVDRVKKVVNQVKRRAAEDSVIKRLRTVGDTRRGSWGSIWSMRPMNGLEVWASKPPADGFWVWTSKPRCSSSVNLRRPVVSLRRLCQDEEDP